MSNAAKTAYNQRNYDQIHLWVPIGTRKEIEKAAKDKGESINRYVAGAIEEAIRSDKKEVSKLRLDKYEKIV